MRASGRFSLLVLTIAMGACSSATPPTAPTAMLVDAGAPPAPGSSVRFTSQNGVGRLDFSSDFSVSGVPGPYVYLNTTNNANTGRPLRVAALKSNEGAQTYSFQLPANVSYSFVLVWCDPYNVPVAEASIAPTP
jgi:hypothetical protein